jgi:glycosyltransferase involved in cell wall biosynthesis
MKILSIHLGLSVGGVAKYAIAIEGVRELMPVQLRSLCILPVKRSVDNEALSALDATILPVRSLLNPFWVKRVRKIINDENPDCIMSHGFNAHLVSLLGCYGKNRSIYRLASYHGPYHAPSVGKKLLVPFYNWFTYWFVKYKAASVLCVAQYCADFLIRQGVPANKLAVIHNGIPDFQSDSNSREDVRRKWGFTQGHIVIGIASRLDHIKGLNYLIDAFARIIKAYPEARLVLMGDGLARKSLEKQTETLGIRDQVTFAGICSDVSRCLAALDIFALPSLAESHSIGLLEAMRAGLPSIVTDVGGNTESVRNEHEGLVVAAADVEGLTVAMTRMIGDAALRMRLGMAARKRFLVEFTHEAMLNKTAQWLKSVV